MKRTVKVWLIIAASMLVVGCMIFIGGMSMLNWNFSNLATIEYVTNTYEIKNQFKNIYISSNTANITFVPCEASKSSVVCKEIKNTYYNVSSDDNNLIIEFKDTRKWYDHIGVISDNTCITVYIPEGEYQKLSIKSNTGNIEIPKNYSFSAIDITQNTGDVTAFASASEYIHIKTSTGKICIEDLETKNISLTASTGKITASRLICNGDFALNVSTGKAEISNIRCNSFNSKGDTGSIDLTDVVAQNAIFIERDTGNVYFNKCDAAEISVKTDTGSVKGSLLSEKIFVAKSHTGRIDIPKTSKGGRCEITTDTGSIKITIN